MAQHTRVADETIQAVRALPIRDIVAQYVTLRVTSNAHAKGLCPFHDEKTPSFNANATTNTWHCFGCGEGGDVIDFVMKVEALDFKTALATLAAQHGIAVEDGADPDDVARARHRRTRLTDALTIAAELYGNHLGSATRDAQHARDWLTTRGFAPKDVFDTFGVGLSPRTGDALCTHLIGRGFTIEELVAAGLARANDAGRVRDFFVGRLMWPIRDNAGATIGFGARKLFDNDRHPAKFINTPETDLYHKSRVLFGINLARKAIAATGHAIVVEGYTDVVALHAAGHTNTIATCGTACTPDHIAALRRMTGPDGEITFGFDPDAAGVKAAVRAYDLVKAGPVRATALVGADGDPAEVYQHHGPAAIDTIVGNRVPLLRTVIDAHLAGTPLATDEDQVAAIRSLSPLLREVPDDYLRARYTKYVASSVGVPLTYVEEHVTTTTTTAHSRRPNSTPTAKNWEVECARALVHSHDAALEWAPVADGMFATAPANAVLDGVRAALDTFTGAHPWPAYVAATCDPTISSVIAGLLATPLPTATVDSELEYADAAFTRLHEQQAQTRVDALTNELRTAPADNVATISEALAEAQERLRVIQEGAG